MCSVEVSLLLPVVVPAPALTKVTAFVPFQETLASMIDNVQQAVADSAEHDVGRVEREARTQKNVPGMRHPLGKGRRQVNFMPYLSTLWHSRWQHTICATLYKFSIAGAMKTKGS